MSLYFAQIIRYFSDILNTGLRELTSDFSLRTLVFVLGTAFVYGIVHSAGPGHGKIIVLSYFLKDKQGLRKSMILGAIVSIVHSGSAIIIAFLLSYVLKGLGVFFKIKLQNYMMIASGLLLALIGVVYLAIKLRHRHNTKSIGNSYKSLILFGVSAGIVPCPVALMIMTLAISKGFIISGFLIVLAMSAGMFILISGVGALGIITRGSIMKWSGKYLLSIDKISVIIEYLSILVILLLGILIIYSSWS